MTEKPRTAGDVVLRVANQLRAAGPHTSPKAIARMSAAEKTLESWRRELLADGWTFLPGEMPRDRQDVLAALRDDEGCKWLEACTYTAEDGFEVFLFPEFVYAWRPLPEPPEVRGNVL